MMPAVSQRRRPLLFTTIRQGEYRSFVLLLLLPFILCLVLFVAVHYVIRGEIQSHAEQTATQFYLQSSAMLREMDRFGEALANNAGLVAAMSRDAVEAPDSQAICNFLRESITQTPYISHVYIINQSQTGIYSDEGYFSYNSLSAILSKIGVNRDGIDFTAQLDEETGRQLSVSSFTPYRFLPINSPDGSQVLGTAIVTMNLTSFLLNFYALDASLCCVFNDSFFISSALSMATDRTFDWRDQAAVTKLIGERVTCVYRESEDYTYLVAVSNSDYNKPLFVIIVSFFIYAFSILLAGFLSLRKITLKRRAEIGALIDALPNYTGEAAYASVIPAIKQSLEEYRHQQEHADQQIQERNLRYLLYGHNPSIVTDEFIHSAGIPLPFPRSYYVVTFHLRDMTISPAFDVGKRQDNEDLARLMLRSTLSGLITPPIGFTSCADINSLVAVFWSEESDGFREQTLRICGDAIDLLLENYNITLQAMVSNRFTDISGLPDAFNRARDLNEYASSTDNPLRIISQEELLGQDGAAVAVDFVRQEQILANSLLAQKYGQIPELVRSILEKSVSPLQKDYDLARSRLRTVANLLAEAVMAENRNDIPSQEIIQRFRKVNSVTELNTVTKEYFSRLSARMEEAADENEIVRRACGYIKENLRDHNLNVSAICEAAQVSPQRLTRMFQTHFDATIAEYMNTRRIEQAKELLRNSPKLSVAQIAEIVGYNNTPSLTRNFRKLEGLTPSEYRELNL